MLDADLHTLQTEQDKLLFNKIAGGDQEAFRALFDKFVPRMRPAIRAITGEEAPVKDIIQDVFLLLWISREKLTTVVSPENWLFRMVHYECYKWLRKQKVMNKASNLLAPQEIPLKNPTEEYTNFMETSRLLKQAVANLPPQAQKVYLLRREENLSPHAIGQKLSISEKTVKNTLTRALKSIQEHLRKHGILVPLVILDVLL